MKHSFFSITIFTSLSFVSFIQSVQADFSSDAELIFNDAQQVYSTYFPSNQETKSVESWVYRHYPSNGVYLGINKQDMGIYVLGGIFGDLPVYVDDKNAIMIILKNLKEGFSFFCENYPEGSDCKQNGYTIRLTTHGQCIKVPQDNSQKTETGINILSQIDTTALELSGISTNSVNRQGFFDATLQASANHCVIHAQDNPPEDLSLYRVNGDICEDITSNIDSIADEADIIEFNPPITVHIAGTEVNTYVSDCFSTDAVGISNKVTKERWLRNNGEFIKIQ